MNQQAVCCLVVLLVALASAKVDFCEDNQLPSSKKSPTLQFTKEQSVWEYAVDSKFKSLHCCAKGYLSIEWFKDGKAYPWPGDVSSFIIYPESENQTIYTKALRASDAGNYSCRIHNDTQHFLHITELKVFDSSGYMEKPLATYRPPAISSAVIGEEKRVFCEAFVGDIDLPDATSEVSWLKKGNSTLENPHIKVEQVQRENGQIVGAYLIISKVEWSDLGTYTCTISNTGDQKIMMETHLKVFTEGSEQHCFQNHKTLIVVAFILSLLCLAGLYIFTFFKRNDTTLNRLWMKMTENAPFNKQSRFKSGIVIIHAENDGAFVEEAISPLVKAQTGFFIFTQKVNNNNELFEETKELCRNVQRTIIILSRNLTNEWSREGINRTLGNLIMKEPTYLVVLLESLPEPEDKLTVPYFEKVSNKFNLLLWDDASTGNHIFSTNDQAPQPILHRLEHREPHSPFDIFHLSRNRSSEVHV
ncbi:uncharacterized protein LOC106661466 [Cimex lectularius]|uniref:Soluble interferon alpha/beta receptor OPG204 n=1 Tax=Cimex lectularius TaxID=79782 RepID=A0A8I6R791_CIMLE|nr:uncharacterized protein LOC106661466 [Cimex lectularius]